jgi:esterase/lipase superfamily enzyme
VTRDIDAGRLAGDWVFFVHGFNQSFPENLRMCHQLQQKYGVNVIAFSWPSNRGGAVTQEYRDARQAAQGSGNALDRTLEKLGRYMQTRATQILHHSARDVGCSISINLLAHSLGNYVIEAFIRQPIFSGETQIFDNVILHQADVDHNRHAEWLDKVNSKHIYVTLNERDKILKASNIINSPRLGNTVENLNAQRPIYVDFTGARNVGDSHNLFLGVDGNPALEEFCRQVLKGGRGEMSPQFQFIAKNNTYRITEVTS